MTSYQRYLSVKECEACSYLTSPLPIHPPLHPPPLPPLVLGSGVYGVLLGAMRCDDGMCGGVALLVCWCWYWCIVITVVLLWYVRVYDNNVYDTDHWTDTQKFIFLSKILKITNIILLFRFWLFSNGSIGKWWSQPIELASLITGGVTLVYVAFLTGELWRFYCFTPQPARTGCSRVDIRTPWKIWIRMR